MGVGLAERSIQAHNLLEYMDKREDCVTVLYGYKISLYTGRQSGQRTEDCAPPSRCSGTQSCPDASSSPAASLSLMSGRLLISGRYLILTNLSYRMTQAHKIVFSVVAATTSAISSAALNTNQFFSGELDVQRNFPVGRVHAVRSRSCLSRSPLPMPPVPN